MKGLGGLGASRRAIGAPRWQRRIVIGLAGVVWLCLLAPVVSALSNVGLPERSGVVERLSEADKARLAETLHLRQSLGEAVWPGWGAADIPVILYNEGYAFLVGMADPPAGWATVPRGAQRGGLWEAVAGDLFEGQTYYRRVLADAEATPQAFVVRVGERWVASMTTLEWTRIKLRTDMRSQLPAFLGPLVPYRLVTWAFGSDWHMAAVGHESFHALQGQMAPERLAAAEAVNQLAGDYPWDDAAFRQAWAEELNLLRRAMRAETQEEATALAQVFLEARETRRSEAGLSAALADFERQREWLEGLAKYAELESWRQGATAAGYSPLPQMAQAPDFAGYQGFEQRWNSEVVTLGNQAGAGETRFYYSGWAQAVLLDRLAPDWKAGAMEEGVWLEGLLEEAVQSTSGRSGA
jgi:hypothetical protein